MVALIKSFLLYPLQSEGNHIWERKPSSAPHTVHGSEILYFNNAFLPTTSCYKWCWLKIFAQVPNHLRNFEMSNRLRTGLVPGPEKQPGNEVNYTRIHVQYQCKWATRVCWPSTGWVTSSIFLSSEMVWWLRRSCNSSGWKETDLTAGRWGERRGE